MKRRIFEVESLERRSLLDGDFAPVTQFIEAPTGGITLIQGTKHDDVITVTGSRGNLLVNYNGQIIPLAQGTRYVYIDGNDGNDTISNLSSVDSVIHGGLGNDTIVTSGTGFDVVRGDEGQDTLVGDEFDFLVEEPEFFEPFDVDVLGDVLIVYTRATNGDADNVVTVEDGLITVDEISTILYSPELVAGIVIDTNDGRDVIVNTSNTQVVAYGGDGKDTFIGQEGDSFYGEQGHDTFLIG